MSVSRMPTGSFIISQPGRRSLVRGTALAAALAAAVALPGAASALPPAAGAIPLPTAASAAMVNPGFDQQELQMCQQINSYRAQHGLPALLLSPTLTRAATWMSGDMARKNYFDHRDSLGRSDSRRISAFGYRGPIRGENLASGTDGSAATMLALWKGSPPHNRNLLRRSYKVIGVSRSFSQGTSLGWVWTADFGGTRDNARTC